MVSIRMRSSFAIKEDCKMFTFHLYWGAFCQGAFVLDLRSINIYKSLKQKQKKSVNQLNTSSNFNQVQKITSKDYLQI